ncbi:HD domain-containing protein [Streptomyces sp. NPDC001941]|uniref:HD domain-containing protein n=1 Tax=Streptomyces sp. NPDC001941 TaxID=3154659 RepID=UPI00333115BE
MTTPRVRSIALDPSEDPALRPLPAPVADLLVTLAAPPRLVAHLRLVHDVAVRISDWTQRSYPSLRFDRDAVLFGAATHDIGKTVHPAELSGPGARHEEAGSALLLEHGVPADLARFAASHASWDDPATPVEDLLVSLADKVWKNKRVTGLEDRVVAALAQAGGREPWDVFLELDAFLEGIGDTADERLAYQARHPTA